MEKRKLYRMRGISKIPNNQSLFKREKTYGSCHGNRTFIEELRQGGGEIIGFLSVLPCVIFMMVIFISVVQLGSVKERLELTAYLACRQAVVASDINHDGKYMDDAKKAAKDRAKQDLDSSSEIFDRDSLKVSLELLKKGDAEGEDDESRDLKWEKGNYVKCTVSVRVSAPTPFLSGRKSASIVMMIEKPANEGMVYPWFEHFS